MSEASGLVLLWRIEQELPRSCISKLALRRETMLRIIRPYVGHADCSSTRLNHRCDFDNALGANISLRRVVDENLQYI